MLSTCNRLFLLLIGIALFSCAEKTIPLQVLQQPEIKPEDTVATDTRQEKYLAGIAAMSIRDFSSAKQIFTEFIRNNPEMAGAYTNLALIQFENSEYDQAIELVNRAIELNDRQAQAYNLRAQLKIIDAKIHEAKDDYHKAIELNPKYTNAQYNLALLYDLYLQDVKLAVKHYEIYMSLIKQVDETTRNWLGHLKRTLNNG